MIAETLRILLVEDNPGDARLLCELLSEARSLHAEIAHAPRVSDAIALLREQPFDVVLLDLSLPDAMGTDTVARVHTAAPHTAIVVLTGLDDEAAALSAMAAGAEDYLRKGEVEAAILGRAIRYAVQRKRAEDNVRRLVREQAARAQAEAAERRARFLAEVGRALADTLGFDATIMGAARVAVPTLADVAIVDVIDDSGDVRRAGAAIASAQTSDIDTVLDLLPHSDDDDPMTRAVRTGSPILIADLDPQTCAALARDHDAIGRLLDRFDPQALMVLPLTARGRTIGAMGLLSTSAASWMGTIDLPFAQEVAARVALAIDNAKLLRSREDMLSIVSHDLRNPLNVIGFVGATLRRPNVSDEQRFAYAEKLRRAADQMNRLIQDLLDASRMESGTLPVDASPLPATALVTDVLELMRPLADDKKVRLVSRATDGLPHVLADRERMRQVFANLVGNAIKFTPQGGSVTLSAFDDGGEVRFTVTDTGPGISHENLSRIFDRFWQAKRTTGGAGLGLAIAKGLVFAHQGRIWAESDGQCGATFHVALPKPRALPELESAPQSSVA